PEAGPSLDEMRLRLQAVGAKVGGLKEQAVRDLYARTYGKAEVVEKPAPGLTPQKAADYGQPPAAAAFAEEPTAEKADDATPADVADVKKGLAAAGFHFHPAQDKITGEMRGDWFSGGDAHWETYPKPAAGVTDAQLAEAAKRDPAPLPEGGEKA